MGWRAGGVTFKKEGSCLVFKALDRHVERLFTVQYISQHVHDLPR